MYAEIGNGGTPADTQIQEQDLRTIFRYNKAGCTKICAWWILDIDKYTSHHKYGIEVEKQISEFFIPLSLY